jgi:2,4-dienoyl-CoA reductase-like NADH-dependent reductase (Old Yellow Enzyme family)
MALAFAEPLKLPSETLPNRLAKAAMTEGLADAQGRATLELARLYETWGASGAGLLITGNVQIDARHLERPGNVIVSGPQSADAMSALRRWSAAARRHHSGFWMQISHGGRQTPSLVNPTPKAPSAVPLALPGKQFGAPVPLTEDEITDLIARFANAVSVAREAGFTGAQVHAAHGYLISQFLNPRANQRTDAWGGSLENRARFLLEVVRAARAKVGADFTLAVKLNSADFQQGGFSPQDSVQVAQWLEQAGVDVLELSGGNYEQPKMMNMEGLEKADTTGLPASTARREAYFLDFALAMCQSVTLPLMVTGGFRTAAAMDEAVKSGISIIGIARPMVTEPHAPKRLLEGAAALEDKQSHVRLGGGWLGPRSPFKTIRAINGFGVLYWQYQQLRRLGRGEEPDLSLPLMKAMSAEMKTQQALARAAAGG